MEKVKRCRGRWSQKAHVYGERLPDTARERPWAGRAMSGWDQLRAMPKQVPRTVTSSIYMNIFSASVITQKATF